MVPIQRFSSKWSKFVQNQQNADFVWKWWIFDDFWWFLTVLARPGLSFERQVPLRRVVLRVEKGPKSWKNSEKTWKMVNFEIAECHFFVRSSQPCRETCKNGQNGHFGGFWKIDQKMTKNGHGLVVLTKRKIKKCPFVQKIQFSKKGSIVPSKL